MYVLFKREGLKIVSLERLRREAKSSSKRDMGTLVDTFPPTLLKRDATQSAEDRWDLKSFAEFSYSKNMNNSATNYRSIKRGRDCGKTPVL